MVRVTAAEESNGSSAGHVSRCCISIILWQVLSRYCRRIEDWQLCKKQNVRDYHVNIQTICRIYVLSRKKLIRGITQYLVSCHIKMICYAYLKDESEPGAVLHLLVSNLDLFALLNGQPSQQGIQHGVHTLPNVLQQQTVSISHCIKVPGIRRRSITQLVQKVDTCTESCI